MLRVNWPTERTGKGAPGKSSPADFAFTCPRPPLRSFTKEYSNKKAPLKPLRRQRGLCRFFGANSVASALGIRSGATPCGLIQPNIQLRNTRSKPDILTLLGLGHFYFALTETSHFIPALSKIYGDASPKLYRCIPGRRLDPKAHRNGLRVFGIYDARPHSCRTFPDLVRGEWSLVARMWQMPEKATFCPIAYNTLEAFKDEVDFKK